MTSATKLLAVALLAGDGEGRVALDEIEARVRALGGSAQRVIGQQKQTALVAGVVSGALVIAAAYLHGRRRGRRRASVLEVRRI